jgi:hypothetical protein
MTCRGGVGVSTRCVTDGGGRCQAARGGSRGGVCMGHGVGG